VTEDRRLQLLLIAFAFGAFFEGAAGFGTPVAVTGAVLIGTLINEMQRRSVEYGVVTMCTGLGMGVATVVQRV